MITYKDVEIFFVNNGGSDSKEKYCRPFAIRIILVFCF